MFRPSDVQDGSVGERQAAHGNAQQLQRPPIRKRARFDGKVDVPQRSSERRRQALQGEGGRGLGQAQPLFVPFRAAVARRRNAVRDRGGNAEGEGARHADSASVARAVEEHDGGIGAKGKPSVGRQPEPRGERHRRRRRADGAVPAELYDFASAKHAEDVFPERVVADVEEEDAAEDSVVVEQVVVAGVGVGLWGEMPPERGY
mmetsp:Transcript_16297/g.57875  ORF Transcript_16297/g.57875 Transcript_16297/m.57875 type:complete len:203 (+) Transcript_16297:926-1534(+)